MRSTLNFNSHWQFTKPGAAPVAVTLPHTWNAADGTDGGNDYFRGICTYTKEFAAPAHADDEEVWFEFEGVAMTAVVSLNGKELTRHAGGYSTFRVNLTPALAAQNTLTVTVDNSANRTVYPQKADFTFYGGIYRDVHILIVPHSHFALDNHGAPALRVTPEVSDDLPQFTAGTYHCADAAHGAGMCLPRGHPQRRSGHGAQGAGGVLWHTRKAGMSHALQCIHHGQPVGCLGKP